MYKSVVNRGGQCVSRWCYSAIMACVYKIMVQAYYRLQFWVNVICIVYILYQTVMLFSKRHEPFCKATTVILINEGEKVN